MRIDVDASEVKDLGIALIQIPAKAVPKVRPVVSKGALNIKKQLQREMGRSRHFGQVSRAINYDIKGDGHEISAEIGPEKGGAGSLGNIAYFGTSRGGGTVPDPAGALLEEAPNFVDALENIAGDLL